MYARFMELLVAMFEGLSQAINLGAITVTTPIQPGTGHVALHIVRIGSGRTVAKGKAPRPLDDRGLFARFIGAGVPAAEFRISQAQVKSLLAGERVGVRVQLASGTTPVFFLTHDASRVAREAAVQVQATKPVVATL